MLTFRVKLNHQPVSLSHSGTQPLHGLCTSAPIPVLHHRPRLSYSVLLSSSVSTSSRPPRSCPSAQSSGLAFLCASFCLPHSCHSFSLSRENRQKLTPSISIPCALFQNEYLRNYFIPQPLFTLLQNTAGDTPSEAADAASLPLFSTLGRAADISRAALLPEFVLRPVTSFNFPGPLVPLRWRAQSARIVGVSGAPAPGTYTLLPVSKEVRADNGCGKVSVPPPVASRFRQFGTALARRPGSTVLRLCYKVEPTSREARSPARVGKAGSVRLG